MRFTVKHLVWTILLGLSIIELRAQNDPVTIRKQIATIRQSTNWDNPEEAKKASAQIRELNKKILQGATPLPRQNTNQEEEPDRAEAQMQTIDQMLKSAREGEQADILLGEPIRREIVEEFRDDESPLIKNAMFLEKLTVLCIDMSLPTIQRTIDQMPNFKSVKVLIITCSKDGATADLSKLFDKAAHYPLTELYIINFGQRLSSIPQSLSRFKNLSTLSVVNNGIARLPGSVTSLASLKNLYLDLNPLKTLMPEIASLKRLEKLGIGKTSLSAGEKKQLSELLPNCQIFTQ